MLLFKKKAKLSNECSPSQPVHPALTAAEIKRFIADIPCEVGRHQRSMAEVFQVAMDYTPESIDDLDELISRHWRKPPPQLEMMVLEFGCYLGQTVRRLHGGEWTYNTNCGWSVVGIGGHDIKIHPFDKVRQRFIVGQNESLSAYYTLIRSQIESLSSEADHAEATASAV